MIKYLFIFLLITNAVCGQCPDGWSDFQESCYMLMRNLSLWEDARTGCHSTGAKLATLHNQLKDMNVRAYLQMIQQYTADVWVGGDDRNHESHWVWTETGRPMEFANWNPGQPNDRESKEDCLALSGSTFKWMDADCNDRRLAYVCEKRATIRNQPLAVLG